MMNENGYDMAILSIYLAYLYDIKTIIKPIKVVGLKGIGGKNFMKSLFLRV